MREDLREGVMNDIEMRTADPAAVLALSRRRWIVSGSVLLTVMVGVSALLIAAALYLR